MKRSHQTSRALSIGLFCPHMLLPVLAFAIILYARPAVGQTIDIPEVDQLRSRLEALHRDGRLSVPVVEQYEGASDAIEEVPESTFPAEACDDAAPIEAMTADWFPETTDTGQFALPETDTAIPTANEDCTTEPVPTDDEGIVEQWVLDATDPRLGMPSVSTGDELGGDFGEDPVGELGTETFETAPAEEASTVGRWIMYTADSFATTNQGVPAEGAIPSTTGTGEIFDSAILPSANGVETSQALTFSLSPTPTPSLIPSLVPSLSPTLAPTPIPTPSLDAFLTRAAPPTLPEPTPPPVRCCACLYNNSRPNEFTSNCRTFDFKSGPIACDHTRWGPINEDNSLPKPFQDWVRAKKCNIVNVAVYRHGYSPMCTQMRKASEVCLELVAKNGKTGKVAIYSIACNIFEDEKRLEKDIAELEKSCPKGFICSIAAHPTIGIINIGGAPQCSWKQLSGPTCSKGPSYAPYYRIWVDNRSDKCFAEFQMESCDKFLGNACHNWFADQRPFRCAVVDKDGKTTGIKRLKCQGGRWRAVG